jgi:hypothetical protein
VRARVEAFIADFHAAWRRSGSVPMPTFNPFTAGPDSSFDPMTLVDTAPDFAAWEQELARLVGDHFTPGARTGAEGALSGKPDHDPGAERIVHVEVKRATAVVKSVFPDNNLDNHFTYRLASTDDGWRISKVVHTFTVPDQRLISADEVERLVNQVDAGTAAPDVPADLARGVASLFAAPHDVVDLGTLATSGVLTVHDFGWVSSGFAPLRRRVPPGSYPVELSRDGDGTNVALRLRFSDRNPVTRVAAERVDQDNVISVDAGNVAVLDFLALASCGAAQVEETYQDQLEEILESPGTVFSLTGAEAEAVMVTSGYGDGAYPAYWGVAADGSLTDLVVDFLVNIEDVTSTVRVPWAAGPSTHELLREHQLEVIVEPPTVVFRYRPEAGERVVKEIRVCEPGGDPVAGQGGGVFVQGGVHEQRWTPSATIPDGSTLEVTLSHGYRHV